MTVTDPPVQRPPQLRGQGIGRHADKLFSVLLAAAGTSVLVILAAIVIRTTVDAWPVFQYQGFFQFVVGTEWRAGFARTEFTGNYGAFPFIFGTLFVAGIALVLALPLAIAVSVFIVHYAPPRLRVPLSYVVEVLAAIPSIIFGLWGLLWFVPTLVQPVTNWTARNLGFIPFLSEPVPNVNYFHAGFVLAIMILPIITAITREIIAAAPLSEQEAAYGLGATKWEVIRSVVLPRSFSGIVGASMLGLGRALGETIAVLMLIGSSQKWDFRLFFPGDTMAAHIAATFQDASPETITALLGIGVVLFLVTMVVNIVARGIVWKFGFKATGDAI
ncbi:MAG: phosphate ABC transporter permease subunit PstC [Nocardiopsis sp. BM-2018]|nr:MAG: phosphate ABC transporter permease subunit PstC [Nocardiopsis sp. BM-2018]